MKYYFFSYIWERVKTGDRGFGMDLKSFSNGMTGLYEHISKRPIGEHWCLTHVAEVTKEEYEKAKK